MNKLDMSLKDEMFEHKNVHVDKQGGLNQDHYLIYVYQPSLIPNFNKKNEEK